MKQLTFFFCLIAGIGIGQAPQPKFGFYTLKNGESTEYIQVVDDVDVDGEEAGNIYVGDAEVLQFFRYNSAEKRFECRPEGELSMYLTFSKVEIPEIKLTNLRLETTTTWVYFGTNPPESDLSYEEEYAGDYSEGEEMSGSEEFEFGEEDPLIVGNPHHIDNVEYFNPERSENLPALITFWEYRSQSRLAEIFENADALTAERKEQIAAVVDVMDNNQAVKTYYVIYNEKEQTHDCYDISNTLKMRMKFFEEWLYMDIIDVKTKGVFGRMNQLNFESPEFTPKGSRLLGIYHLQNATNDRITLESDFESGKGIFYFENSPYGRVFNFDLENMGDQIVCKDENGKAIYSISYPKDVAGVLELKDLKTGVIVRGTFDFDQE
jgi:hypothetical protein